MEVFRLPFVIAMAGLMMLVSANMCEVKFEDNNACACSAKSSGDGAVSCIDNQTVEIWPCYCMYYDVALNLSLVGNCYSSCYEFGNTVIQISTSEEFNEEICDQYVGGSLHRTGRFCGQCKEDYGLAVYSYEVLSCIPCESFSYTNVLKYFAVALLPLTVFYILAVFLSFNATSSSLSGILMIVQCITSPLQMNIIASNPLAAQYGAFLQVVLSLICIVNLDFFRTVYSPFCLHPNANILEVLSLDYIAALYPFLLIFLTYLLVTAYDREYKLLMLIWKPFKWCLSYHRRAGNVKTSLIEIFATFILLSSVKILGVSFQILSFTVAHDLKQKRAGAYLLLDGNMKFFGSKHAPFALLACIISFVFVILPMILLILYPCRIFQRYLNRCGRVSQVLHVFMDAFQGHYRTDPIDLRYFSVFYLILRVLLLAQVSLISTYLLFYTSGVISFAAAAVVAMFQPFKVKAHNTRDTVLLLLMGVYFISYYNLIILSSLNYWSQWIVSAICEGFCVGLLILYGVAILLWQYFRFKVIALMQKLKSAWSRRSFRRSNSNSFVNSYEERGDGSDLDSSSRLLVRSLPTY